MDALSLSRTYPDLGFITVRLVVGESALEVCIGKPRKPWCVLETTLPVLDACFLPGEILVVLTRDSIELLDLRKKKRIFSFAHRRSGVVRLMHNEDAATLGVLTADNVIKGKFDLQGIAK